ncbi:EAL domain-containing protein [Paenibacillus sp. 1011MAR3C5]|uniref:putative bifunctional diguanylate cyclase/phosphodiesterase n=1 Tax=Paenibacillus sp. 1011MAR3C5 TaxID=1675787 RepID=UPI000E6CB360|nr:EAL domain-containing protein [Paenibacillus sp. 1011MAR3C5]RJE84318.1 EAL domain-containing protein [Paenibacillus sp. 1011MAR3C5]
MKWKQAWIKRLIQITPLIVIFLTAISLSLNTISSVSSSQGHMFALVFAVFILASILVKPLWLKYGLAVVAFVSFFNALPELSFDKLISVMYLTLVLLAFLLPSPIPVFAAAGYYLYITPIVWPEESPAMLQAILGGVIINMILYSLLAFYFRNLRKENVANAKLNAQLNEALLQLEHMAYYDTLTGLPNRQSLMKHLNTDIAQQKPLAVLFLDLDQFKHVNDMMGHRAGDQLLRDVADHLRHFADSSCFLARYAGDEFVLLCSYRREEEIADLAERLVRSFQNPFHIEHKQVYTTSSIGISLFPEDAEEGETLIQYADKTMYSIKRGDKNGYRFFSDIKNEELLRQVRLANDIRSAITKNEMSIHYQPLVELETGVIRGVEALLRWTHSDMGPIAPTHFIPLAEQNGVIVELGEWVLEEACRQVKSWHEAGNAKLTLAVNLSIRQFKSLNFPSRVLNILEKTDFDPALLELEVTESMMQNVEESVPILNELKRHGIKISIDDFGTGYSSLSVLGQLPLDYLKIDRSFTKELTSDVSSASIVRLIIDIGHSMNLQVICEGIETGREVEALRQFGCEYGQGYYFQRPSPPNEIERLLDLKQLHQSKV